MNTQILIFGTVLAGLGLWRKNDFVTIFGMAVICTGLGVCT